MPLSNWTIRKKNRAPAMKDHSTALYLNLLKKSLTDYLNVRSAYANGVPPEFWWKKSPLKNLRNRLLVRWLKRSKMAITFLNFPNFWCENEWSGVRMSGLVTEFDVIWWDFDVILMKSGQISTKITKIWPDFTKITLDFIKITLISHTRPLIF